MTKRVHDYRIQHIRDLKIQEKETILQLKKRRYHCKYGKRFYEKYNFLPKYHRMTNRLYMHICHKMMKNIPVTTIAEELNMSDTTVTRVFDHVKYPTLSELPEVKCLAIRLLQLQYLTNYSIIRQPSTSKVIATESKRKRKLCSIHHL